MRYKTERPLSREWIPLGMRLHLPSEDKAVNQVVYEDMCHMSVEFEQIYLSSTSVKYP